LIYAFLGVTFLIAALFPIGAQLAQLTLVGISGGVFKGSPPLLFHLVALLLTYAPAALVTAWFVKSSNLRVRLPRQVPGSAHMILGVGLTCAYVAVRLFASTIEGGGPSFMVAQFSPFVLWPARVLLLVGVVRLLLAASPSNPSIDRTTSDKPVVAPHVKG
jgi:hypothetical protein